MYVIVIVEEKEDYDLQDGSLVVTKRITEVRGPFLNENFAWQYFKAMHPSLQDHSEVMEVLKTGGW